MLGDIAFEGDFPLLRLFLLRLSQDLEMAKAVFNPFPVPGKRCLLGLVTLAVASAFRSPTMGFRRDPFLGHHHRTSQRSRVTIEMGRKFENNKLKMAKTAGKPLSFSVSARSSVAVFTS